MVPAWLGQDPAVVDVGLGAAAGVHRGQPLGRGDVHVAQALVGAGGGLVDVQHPHPAQQLAHPGQERRLQQAGGAAAHTGDEPDRDPDPGQGRHQRGRPADGQVVRAGQLRGGGEHPRPVLGAGWHPLRGGPGPWRRAAGAGAGDDPVLGHARWRGRGDVGDLTTLHPATGAPVRSAPQSPQRSTSRSRVSFGLSTSGIVVPPGRAACRACGPRRCARSDRSGLRYGGSDEGGFEEVVESEPSRRSNSSIRATCAASCADSA